MKPIPGLKTIEPTPPGPTALAVMETHKHRRSLNFSDLVLTEGMCVWCNVVKVVKPRFRWCSDQCVRSAVIHAHPQSNDTKMWLLIHRQGMACAGCGECYEDDIVAKAKTWLKYNEDNLKRYVSQPDMVKRYGFDDTAVTYYQLGYNTGDKWHVDHMLPLHQGGDGIGLHNVQVLCVACHRRKTVIERHPSAVTQEQIMRHKK